jgi:hypothetical protein
MYDEKFRSGRQTIERGQLMVTMSIMWKKIIIIIGSSLNAFLPSGICSESA